MAKKNKRRPTDAELEILQVLWDHGPGTVREVHAHVNEAREAGTTTVLKHMQIMVEKGLLSRDESVRPQVYSSAQSRKQTQRHLTNDFLERAFGGSPGKLVLQALETKRSTPEELRQIRALLDELEEEEA